MGLINNCRGIFLSPVTRDLGLSMGGFSLYMLLSGICACLFTPLASRTLARHDSRRVLGGMSLVFSASVFAMGLMRTLPGFYAAGIVQGISGAFLMFFPAPLILGHWFKKRSGLAVGVCSAFSGVIGILGNPLGNAVIRRLGWQWGYFSFGIASLAMMLPVSVFVLRLRPEDAGCLPYGQEPGETAEDAGPVGDTGLPAAQVRRTVWFFLTVLAALGISMSASFNSHLSPMGVSFGYGDRVGALLVSLSMAGSVLSKFLLGAIYDRRGLAALPMGLGASAAGVALLLTGSLPARLAGAFLYGFSLAVGNIMTPLIVKNVYGLRGYRELLGYASTALTLGNALSMPIGGWMVDRFGPVRGYIYSLRGVLVLFFAVGLLHLIAIPGVRRLTAEAAPRSCGAIDRNRRLW